MALSVETSRMTALQECQQSVTICLLIRRSSGTEQTDGQTGLVEQYRALHALHADAR